MLEFSHIRTFECISRQYSCRFRGFETLNYSDEEKEIEGEDDKEMKYSSRYTNINFILVAKRRDRKLSSKNKVVSLRDRNKILVSELTPKIKGHTGYLTFATCNKVLGNEGFEGKFNKLISRTRKQKAN